MGGGSAVHFSYVCSVFLREFLHLTSLGTNADTIRVHESENIPQNGDLSLRSRRSMKNDPRTEIPRRRRRLSKGSSAKGFRGVCVFGKGMKSGWGVVGRGD